MKKESSYDKGFAYEAFMRRGLRINERSFELGADNSIYETLFHFEEGLSFVKGNTYEKQFNRVKKFMERGFSGYLKQTIFTTEVKRGLEALKFRLVNASSESQLKSIIDEALDLTHPYKEVLTR
ncbi:MAG: hypothetical protein V4608_09980 [Bacteroidota bacterium]